jgi:DNA-binding transcriptional MerR regulator
LAVICTKGFAIFVYLFAINLIMSKSLTQITFDFTYVEEPATAPATTSDSPDVVEEEKVIPQEEVMIVNEPDVVIADKKATAVASLVPSKRGRKSLKDNPLNAELIQIPEDEILFQKQYYSIGAVAAMFNENQSLIRFWETEFDILQPKKNGKGDRFFRPVDIKNLVMIYDLLRRRKFTIEGAKDFLKKNKRAEEKFALVESLRKIKGFLLEMKASL